MSSTLTLEEFYREKLPWMPANLKKEIGHFNVFRLDETLNKAYPPAYRRIDFFKVSLVMGKNRFGYADRTVDLDGKALVFSNPMIPFLREQLSDNQSGYFCLFTESFFRQFGHFREYPLFQPGSVPVFALDDGQAAAVGAIFEKMLTELNSDYAYKYDVLRNLVFEIVHLALKMQPAATSIYADSNASTRISSLFTELLERQFPIESPSQQVVLRAPSQYAAQLSVHVNHLNRALRLVSGKTTSRLIAERLTQEAKSLLLHTKWNVGEVAWCLGFEERSHFINFFKKNTRLSPGAFRDQVPLA
jgi:AraC family transcriptional regulator, transcriptional activator of pobA